MTTICTYDVQNVNMFLYHLLTACWPNSYYADTDMSCAYGNGRFNSICTDTGAE